MFKLTVVASGVSILTEPMAQLTGDLRSCEGKVFSSRQIGAILPSEGENGAVFIDTTTTYEFDVQSFADGKNGSMNVVMADGTTASFQETKNIKFSISQVEDAAEEQAPPQAPARGRQAAPAPQAPAPRGRQAAPVVSADDLGDFDEGGDLNDDGGYDPESDPDMALEAPAPAPARGRQAAPQAPVRGRQAAPQAPAPRGRQAAPVQPEEDFGGDGDFGDFDAPAAAPAPRGRQAAPVQAPARGRQAAPAAPAPRGRQAAPAPAPRGRQAAPAPQADDFGGDDFGPF